MKAIPSGVSSTILSSGSRLQDVESLPAKQALEDVQCYAVFFNALVTSHEICAKGDLIDRFSQVELSKRP